MAFLYLVLFLCILYFIYRSIIDYCLSKDCQINYDWFMKNFIQDISEKTTKV